VPPNDPRTIEVTTTLVDTNQVSKRTFGYDDTVPYNNQNSIKEFDFGSGAPGALLRETRKTFITASNYTGTAVHLRTLESQVSVWDGGGIERARTNFEYDNYSTSTYHAELVSRSAVSGFDAAFSTSYTTRGNVTGVTRYLLTNGTVTRSALKGRFQRTCTSSSFEGRPDSDQLTVNPERSQTDTLGRNIRGSFPAGISKNLLRRFKRL